MDGKKFDDLTEALAAGASRRRVLKLLGGGLAGGLGLALGGRKAARAGVAPPPPPSGPGNSACAKLCAELFPPGKERGQCVADGAKGTGPCAAPVDQCAGVNCDDGNECTIDSCSSGTCSSVANTNAPCAGGTGTCNAAGGCDPNNGTCGNCLEAHAGPGCENAACQNTVCAQDPFCCEVEFDSICANAAATLCDCQ